MKGAVPWLLVVMGLFLITMLLIFSLAFSKTTILSRETLDQNVLFEGDEVETYARSITNSIRLSTAQAIFDFYSENKEAVWQQYDSKGSLIPDYRSKIKGSIETYMNGDGEIVGFVEAHEDFADPDGDGPQLPRVAIDPQDIGSADVKIQDRDIIVEFESDITIKKKFFGTDYTRSFAAESSLVTVFGAMMEKISGEFIGDNMAGTSVLRGIGKTMSGGEPDVCASSKADLKYYIDEEANSGGRTKVSQTQTFGSKEYCSRDDKKFNCGASRPGSTSGNPRSSPDPSEVYSETHGISLEDGESRITQNIIDHLACLESDLDSESTDYTVSFDETYLSPDVSILPSCKIVETNDWCNCESSSCGVDSTRWTCNKVKRIECDFQHQAKVEMKARFQEDGFVYGFWDKKDGKADADSIKVVFGVVAGNK